MAPRVISRTCRISDHWKSKDKLIMSRECLPPCWPWARGEVSALVLQVLAIRASGIKLNNRVLCLPAIVLLNTTFRPGNSGLLRVYVQAF